MLSLNDVISKLHEIFESDNVNVDDVKDVLGAYKSKPRDWAQYAKFDSHKYTRNLVDSGNGKFNIMILCWGEGMGSSIHDHPSAHCFVKILQGTLKETLYEWPDEQNEGPMVEKEVNYYDTNGVTYINDSLGLHRVENPSHTDGAVSMHLYVPPFEVCKAFDQRTGHYRKCPVTFWSKYGERTSCAKPQSAVFDENENTNWTRGSH